MTLRNDKRFPPKNKQWQTNKKKKPRKRKRDLSFRKRFSYFSVYNKDWTYFTDSSVGEVSNSVEKLRQELRRWGHRETSPKGQWPASPLLLWTRVSVSVLSQESVWTIGMSNMYARAHGTHAHYNRVVVKASIPTVHVTDPTRCLGYAIHPRCCHLCSQFFRFSRRGSNLKPTIVVSVYITSCHT